MSFSTRNFKTSYCCSIHVKHLNLAKLFSTRMKISVSIEILCFWKCSSKKDDTNLNILSLLLTSSLFGRLYKSVANFSMSPFCCNASHKHCMWSGLKSNCFRPNSDANILQLFADCTFGDNSTDAETAYDCAWFSFSRFEIESWIRWFSIMTKQFHFIFNFRQEIFQFFFLLLTKIAIDVFAQKHFFMWNIMEILRKEQCSFAHNVIITARSKP